MLVAYYLQTMIAYITLFLVKCFYLFLVFVSTYVILIVFYIFLSHCVFHTILFLVKCLFTFLFPLMMFDNFYNLTMDYKTPLVTSLAYTIYSLKTNHALKNVVPRQRPILSLLTFIMVLHNIILCCFSLTVLIYTAPVVVHFYTTNPFITSIKDPQKILQSKIEFWIWIFYVSKIYEIVDSLILHWNKRPTSFLQMYHHAGAIICCWMLSACDTHLPWIFVCINSFIHTLMYFYYLLATLKLKVPKFYKRLITRMQIIQFVSGVSLLLLHISFGFNLSVKPGLRTFQYLTLLANVAYVTILFFLFKNFERKTYSKEKNE